LYRVAILAVTEYSDDNILIYFLLQSLYTTTASSLKDLQPKWPLVLRSLPFPHGSSKMMYLEVIAVLRYNIHDGFIYACVLKACVTSK